MSTTIPLKQWIQGALERDGTRNNGIVAPSPAYIASALRIAISLTQHISHAEESLKERSSRHYAGSLSNSKVDDACDEIYKATNGRFDDIASLPPPFPVACIDWADCISVSLTQPNDQVCERGESDRNSFLSPSLSGQSDEIDKLLELLDVEHEETQLPSDDQDATTSALQENQHDYFYVERAQILYGNGAAKRVESPRENQLRIYSLGLVFYELFSGGELPPVELLVVESPHGGSLRAISEFQAEEDEQRSSSYNRLHFNDFASTLNLSDDTSSSSNHFNVLHQELNNGHETSSIHNKRHSVNSRSRQSASSSSGTVLSNVTVDCLSIKDVPRPLCDLIINMIDCINGFFMGDDAYSDMVDVTRDLQLMLDKPSVYLHNLDMNKLLLTGLEVDDTLFERNDEFASLECAYRRSVSGSSELAIIAGVSGTGKTTMANRLGKLIASNGGLFLSGKFDQMMQHAEPFSAVASAFNSYCGVLAREEEKERAKLVASKLLTALGSDLSYLVRVIPNVSQIIPESAIDIPPKHDDCVDAQQRLQYQLCQLVEAILSCSEGPLTLFMDDVQWADAASLSVIGHLLKTSRFMQGDQRVFFLGTCRDDEMSSDHSFWRMIEHVSSFGVKTTLITLKCMDNNSVTQVISNLLHLSPRLVGSLSDIVYHKTKGNPLFLSKMLLSLQREGLLKLSLARRRWEWDAEEIQTRKLPDDVAMFFVHSINTLPIDVKIALSVLSCFGASTSCEVVQAIETDLNMNLTQPLNRAITEGLLNKLHGRYCFCHDRIHEAAYSMIEEQDRCLHHMNYGLSLMNFSLTGGDNSLLFTAVTQLNLGGPSAVQDSERYHQIARFNLTAGKRAMEMSDFSLAFSFFDHGMTFLRKKHWRDQYDLSLELYNLAAKCALTIKDLTSLTVICHEVQINARDSEDTFITSFITFCALTYSMISESVEFGLQVLSEQLGIYIPRSISRDDTLELIAQTQSMLNTISEETLLNYHVLTDFKKVMAMKFLAKLETSVLQVNPSLLPLVTIKMVELTIDHGLSPMSAIGFAYFGGVIAELGDVRGGYRYTRLAKALLDKHPSNEIAGEVILQSAQIHAFIEPLRAVNEYRIQGQATAMAAGDVHSACLNKLMFTCPLLWSGVNLSGVKEALIEALHFCEKHNHHTTLFYLKIFIQTTARLIGEENQTHCDNQWTNYAIENKNPYQLVVFYFHKLFLSVVFNKYDEMLLSAQKFFDLKMPSWHLLSSHAVHAFIGGLASFRIYRETKDSLWAQRGAQFKKRILTWKDQGCLWNFENKCFLLDAEDFYSNGNMELAQVAYDNAISSARQHNFQHEEALACELAANFYLNEGNQSVALKYFIKAHGTYFEWGAFAKV